MHFTTRFDFGLAGKAKEILITLALIVIGRIAIADEFAQDFRHRQFDEASIRVIGSQKLVTKEREGLRIVIKPESGAKDAGVKFPLQLMGDCGEAAVELIDVPNPKSGYGTGVALLLEDGGTSGASFQRGRHARWQSDLCHP